MAEEATDAARVPGPGAVRMIVAGWLVVTAVVRLGVIGGGDSGWAAGPIAMMLLSFSVQSLFVVYGRRLRGTAAGWLIVAVQAVLTYLPWVLFGHEWMPGNSGILVAALLLAAGPLAGLPVALVVAAIDV